MKIFYFSKFLREFKKLTLEIKRLSLQREKIFRQNPFDPRLKTHKLSGELDGFWSFSVDYRNRIIFDFDENGNVRFYSVGDHDIYE